MGVFGSLPQELQSSGVVVLLDPVVKDIHKPKPRIGVLGGGVDCGDRPGGKGSGVLPKGAKVTRPWRRAGCKSRHAGAGRRREIPRRRNFFGQEPAITALRSRSLVGYLR